MDIALVRRARLTSSFPTRGPDVKRRIHHIEYAPRARHANGLTLFEPVDRRDARLISRQPAQNIDDFPPELFLPDLAQSRKSSFE